MRVVNVAEPERIKGFRSRTFVLADQGLDRTIEQVATPQYQP